MSATSNLGLTFAYWLHILATVVWIGGLAALSIFVLPAARRTMDQKGYSSFLTAMTSRLQQVGWLCLSVLVFTGLFQMVSHPNYQGFLVIDSSWALAILIKHLTVAAMLLLSIYITWGLMPALQRIAFIQSLGKMVDAAESQKLEGRQVSLLQLNLFLSVIILLLTAWARTAQ
jgi:uncharacterized membrane protein